jgi:hypothetical protein
LSAKPPDKPFPNKINKVDSTKTAIKTQIQKTN